MMQRELMSSQISKSRVANSFSRAAISYDGSAQLQRAVGDELLALCIAQMAKQAVTKEPLSVLDLGCGTGYFSKKLHEQFLNAEFLCLDIAQGMLEHAKEVRGNKPYQWICADAESLPLKASSIDILFSSLALQWCENLEQLFAEISRVLAPGGHVFLSSLGPNSLFELREAWASVDNNVHVNQFVAYQDMVDNLPSDLSVELIVERAHVLEYEKLNQLTSDLKNIGAHNMNAGEAKGLTGRQKIRELKSNYEAYRQKNGKLPASYDVYYLCLKKQSN